MGRIYGQATNVCVWLGPESETSPLAFVQIRRILDLHTFDSLVDEQHTKDWAALSELMRRPWFSRRWVVQEIAFAKTATVHCGINIISWSDLADAVALFGSRGAEIARLFKRDKSFGHRANFLGDVEALGANRLVQTIGKLFRKADDGQRLEKLLSLESLVSNLSALNAARPHDIIYAVLSLANDKISSAKASESFLQRRASVSGSFARPILNTEEGAQKGGVKFSSVKFERRDTSIRALNAIDETVEGKNTEKGKERGMEKYMKNGTDSGRSSEGQIQDRAADKDDSIANGDISSQVPMRTKSDHAGSNSTTSAAEPDPIPSRTSDQAVR